MKLVATAGFPFLLVPFCFIVPEADCSPATPFFQHFINLFPRRLCNPLTWAQHNCLYVSLSKSTACPLYESRVPSWDPLTQNFVFSIALYHTLELSGVLFTWASLSSPLDYKEGLPSFLRRGIGGVLFPILFLEFSTQCAGSKVRGRDKDEADGFPISAVTSQQRPPIQAFCKDHFQLAILSGISSPLAHWKLCYFQLLCNLALSLPGFTLQKSPAVPPVWFKGVMGTKVP